LEIILSHHARQRSAQRNLSLDEIVFVVEHGELLRNTGVIFREMRRKDMPSFIPANHPYQRLVGTTIVMCKCGHYVVTLYRKAEAFHKNRRKTKYSRHEQHECCPYCSAVDVA
jgi:hypothetical protein